MDNENEIYFNDNGEELSDEEKENYKRMLVKIKEAITEYLEANNLEFHVDYLYMAPPTTLNYYTMSQNIIWVMLPNDEEMKEKAQEYLEALKKANNIVQEVININKNKENDNKDKKRSFLD